MIQKISKIQKPILFENYRKKNYEAKQWKKKGEFNVYVDIKIHQHPSDFEWINKIIHPQNIFIFY